MYHTFVLFMLISNIYLIPIIAMLRNALAE